MAPSLPMVIIAVLQPNSRKVVIATLASLIFVKKKFQFINFDLKRLTDFEKRQGELNNIFELSTKYRHLCAHTSYFKV